MTHSGWMDQEELEWLKTSLWLNKTNITSEIFALYKNVLDKKCKDTNDSLRFQIRSKTNTPSQTYVSEKPIFQLVILRMASLNGKTVERGKLSLQLSSQGDTDNIKSSPGGAGFDGSFHRVDEQLSIIYTHDSRWRLKARGSDPLKLCRHGDNSGTAKDLLNVPSQLVVFFEFI